MKEDIENTSDSSKETRSVFIGAKVTLTQKEHIKSLAGQCGITVSDYILSRAYNFKPKARLTKEEAVLLQNLDDCRSDLVKYTSALHGMSTKQRMAMFNQIPFMVGWLKELGNVAENICQFLNAVKEKNKIPSNPKSEEESGKNLSGIGQSVDLRTRRYGDMELHAVDPIPISAYKEFCNQNRIEPIARTYPIL